MAELLWYHYLIGAVLIIASIAIVFLTPKIKIFKWLMWGKMNGNLLFITGCYPKEFEDYFVYEVAGEKKIGYKIN